MKLKKQGWLHAGILTEDIRTSAGRWAAFLGIPEPEIKITTVRTVYLGKECRANLAVAILDSGTNRIELLQPTGKEPSLWRDALNARGEGLHHLAYEVPDLDAALQEGVEAGMTLLQKGKTNTGRYIYMDDTPHTKTVFEFVEFDR